MKKEDKDILSVFLWQVTITAIAFIICLYIIKKYSLI